MRRRRQRGRSLGILVGCALIASIGTLPQPASADEPKPAPAPLPTTGPRPAPPSAPTTQPAPSSTTEPVLQQPTSSDPVSTGSEVGATGAGTSSAGTPEDPSGDAGSNDPVVDGSPTSQGLLDVEDVIGVGGPWMDSLATILEDLASAGRAITGDDLPCVGGRCEVFPGGAGVGTIIALAGILAGLAVLATVSVRRSGWLVRH
jgi:hypothetical protein